MTSLTVWCDEIDVVLDRLRDFELPAGFPFDFSAASLDELESLLLDRLPPAGDPRSPAGGFLEAAAAYVGEALLRRGGGEWDWDGVDDLPVVRPAGDGPAVAPLRVLGRAVREKSGHELRAVLDAWVAAGEPPAAAPPEPVDPWLRRWLADRERVFSGWVAQTGHPATAWDFSPASLAELGRLVIERLPAPGAFQDPANADFVDGAVWYLGEVTRHSWGTRWAFVPGEPGPGDVWTGRPYVKVPDGNATVPIALLKLSVKRADPGYLTDRLVGYWT